MLKQIELFLKKVLLSILLILNTPKRRDKDYEFDENSKVLFIRLNRIGDALVSTPLIHAIKQRIGCKIFVLADKKNQVAFLNNPDIDSLLMFNRNLKGYLLVKSFVKKNDIQTIVDLHDDTSATVSFLIALCKAQNKFGLEKSNKKIFTKTIPRLNAKKYHIIERILEVTKLFGFEAEKSKAKVIYEPEKKAVNNVENLLSNNFPEKKFLAGINISAGSQARFWGVEKYKRLIKLFKGYPVSLILVSTPKDSSAAKEIAEQDTVIFTPGFDEFAALISKLNLLISPDTAAVHLASAFSVPVFGIYVKFNTKEIIWYPYGCKFDCVVTEEPTLENISYETFEQKLKPFLGKLLYE